MIIETLIFCLFLHPLISALAAESRERARKLENENDDVEYGTLSHTEESQPHE